MIGPEHKCSKCSGAMEAGYMLDRAYATIAQGTWIGGTPEPSVWTGLKLKDHEKLNVTTYRCTKCGYLESYALS